MLARFKATRELTHRLCEPLLVDDYNIQSATEVSPPKWHLAHTSWFFETFVVAPHVRGYKPFNAAYSYLFNSYYEQVGGRLARERRGMLSRPSVEDVYLYREVIDSRVGEVVESLVQRGEGHLVRDALELGIQHEQQHQELLLMDIKHNFWSNPLRPAYRALKPQAVEMATESPDSAHWIEFPAGITKIGHEGEGFAFDNEQPRHRVFLEPFKLRSRLVTNAEYLEFIEARGYARPELWLSDGWALVQKEGWQAPLYWEKSGTSWWQMTLAGMRPIEQAEPVVHVSYYEAEAYARFRQERLATEAEWEHAASRMPVLGNFAESAIYHTSPARGSSQFFGDAWEWTASSYLAYPGYRAPEGALGEYNGKFMSGQMVLRGGSCATPSAHARATYRNFFQPAARWAFSGIRLAS